MSTYVHYLPASSTMTVDQALNSAKALNLAQCVVIGHNSDEEFCFRASRMSRKDALWLAERLREFALSWD